MLKPHTLRIIARIAAFAGAVLIAVLTPVANAAISFADEGGSSQTPPPSTDGHGWIG